MAPVRPSRAIRFPSLDEPNTLTGGRQHAGREDHLNVGSSIRAPVNESKARTAPGRDLAVRYCPLQEPSWMGLW